MSEIYTGDQRQYFQLLRKFAVQNIARGGDCPQGFRAAREDDLAVVRGVRDLLFKEDTDIGTREDIVPLMKLLNNIGDPLGHRNETVWVKESFSREVTKFIFENPVYWNQRSESHLEFQALFDVVKTYLNRGLPTPAEGNCIAWKRRVSPETHPMPTPIATSGANSDTDVPQVYYIPGVTKFHHAVGHGDHQLLPQHQQMMSEYDFVCGLVKKKGLADVYYIQDHPNLHDSRPRKNIDEWPLDSAHGFINRFILPDIADKTPDGKWQRKNDMNEVKKRLSRHTFTGHCYGGRWQEEFGIALYEQMLNLDYEHEEILDACKCIGMISAGHRPRQKFDISHIPTLSLCNEQDSLMSEFGPYDFSQAEGTRSHAGVTHGWKGENLHIESAYAPESRTFSGANGRVIRRPDEERHALKSYVQLNERAFSARTYRDLHQVHPCASAVRETLEAMVEASHQGVRDCHAIIEAQREKHLSPEAIDASLDFVQQQQIRLGTTARSRRP